MYRIELISLSLLLAQRILFSFGLFYRIYLCKAPIIQHFSETISGTSTIRSSDQQSRFQETNMKVSDGYSRPKFNIAGAIRHVVSYLFLKTNIFFIDPGVLFQSGMNEKQAWMIWNLSKMENKIISVERILQYTCCRWKLIRSFLALKWRGSYTRSAVSWAIILHSSQFVLLENKSSSFAQLVAEYSMNSKSSFEKSMITNRHWNAEKVSR